MKLLRAFLFVFPAFVVGCAAAGFCGPRNEMVAALTGEKYKEARIGIGVMGDRLVVETYASSDGSTFTILITTPDGKTCIIAAGKGWQQIKPEPAGMKA